MSMWRGFDIEVVALAYESYVSARDLVISGFFAVSLRMGYISSYAEIADQCL